MAGCEEPQGQELLLIDDGRCFLGFGKDLGWHWSEFSHFSFLLFFSLCLSLLSLWTRTRPKETETGRIDHRLEGFCFGKVSFLRGSTKLCFVVYYILDA